VFHCMEEELKNEEILEGDKCHGITVRVIQKKTKKTNRVSYGFARVTRVHHRVDPLGRAGFNNCASKESQQTLRDHLLYVKCKFWIQGRWKLY